MSIKRRKLIKEERQYLLNKYNQKCAYCGCDLNSSYRYIRTVRTSLPELQSLQKHIHNRTIP